jgi:hypothetical protein
MVNVIPTEKPTIRNSRFVSMCNIVIFHINGLGDRVLISAAMSHDETERFSV